MKNLLILFMIFLISQFPLQADRALKLQKMQVEQRVALIIGNNDYNPGLSTLKNPINDARAMRNVLKKRGFEIIYKENASKREMNRLLKKFAYKLKLGGVGLYYFAGHGVNVDGHNFLVGIDSIMDDKDEVKYETLSLNYVTEKMKDAKNRLNIVILDACRNDPFSRGGNGGLAPVSNARGMFIAYATEAGSVASDGKSGENGVFTKYLVQNLKESGASIERVFKNTRADVYDATNGKQSPGVYNQIRGDFYFTLPNSTKSTSKKIIVKKPATYLNVKEKVLNKYTVKDGLALEFYSANGNKEKVFMKMLNSIDSTGFELSDPHERINDAFSNKFGSTKLDTLGVFSMSNDKKLFYLLDKYPKLGAFFPMSLTLYKKKIEDKTWVSCISPNLIIEIVGINDEVDKKSFIDMFRALNKKIKTTINSSKHTTKHYSKLPSKVMTEYIYDINGDSIDFMESFQERFEMSLESQRYIIAGYKNFKESATDMSKDIKYDDYCVYSIAHFKFYYMFADNHPELSVLLPSQIYVYVKNNKLHVGMFRLESWLSILDIKDEKIIEIFKLYDSGIVKVLKKLGGREI